jgi:hypothetical protein
MNMLIVLIGFCAGIYLGVKHHANKELEFKVKGDDAAWAKEKPKVVLQAVGIFMGLWIFASVVGLAFV